MEYIRAISACIVVCSLLLASVSGQAAMTTKPTPGPTTTQMQGTTKPTPAMSGGSTNSMMMTTPLGGGGGSSGGGDMEVWKLVAIIVPSVVGGLTLLSVCYFCCWCRGAALAGCCAAGGPEAAAGCAPCCDCGPCCYTQRQRSPYELKEQRVMENPHYSISPGGINPGIGAGFNPGINLGVSPRGGPVYNQGINVQPRSCNSCNVPPSRGGNGQMMLSGGPSYTSSAQIMPRNACNHC